MTKKNIAFVYPGQGSQKITMGKDFYDNFSEAKEVFNNVDDVLNQKLTDVIFSGDAEILNSTENTQPALMVTSLAMNAVLEKQLGKSTSELCAYVAGHSLGEYSALASVKSLSISDCAKILKIRGDAFKNAGLKTKGAMAAIIGVDIQTAEKIANEAANGDICQVANDNSIGQIVISGSASAIDRSIEIGKKLGAKKVIKLPVSGAFHSELINEAGDILANGLKNITINTPLLPVISNVLAKSVTDPTQINDLLVKQVTSRVRWRESINELKTLGITDIVEIGSGKVLTGLIKRIEPEINCHNLGKIEDLENISELLAN